MSETRSAGVYLESSLAGALGGAQTHAAVLAEWLSESLTVELIVRSQDFSLTQLAEASRTNLSRVRLRSLPPRHRSGPPSIDGAYDMFVAFVHDIPPLCPSPIGVLMVLFPSRPKERVWPWSGGDDGASWLQKRAREAYHELLWRRRFAGYQIKTSLD